MNSLTPWCGLRPAAPSRRWMPSHRWACRVLTPSVCDRAKPEYRGWISLSAPTNSLFEQNNYLIILQGIFQELAEIAGLSSLFWASKTAKHRKFPVISLINRELERSLVSSTLRAQP